MAYDILSHVIRQSHYVVRRHEVMIRNVPRAGPIYTVHFLLYFISIFMLTHKVVQEKCASFLYKYKFLVSNFGANSRKFLRKTLSQQTRLTNLTILVTCLQVSCKEYSGVLFETCRPTRNDAQEATSDLQVSCASRFVQDSRTFPDLVSRGREGMRSFVDDTVSSTKLLIPSLSLPSFPSFLPFLQLESAVSSSDQSGRSPAAKRNLMHFWITKNPLWGIIFTTISCLREVRLEHAYR